MGGSVGRIGTVGRKKVVVGLGLTTSASSLAPRLGSGVIIMVGSGVIEMSACGCLVQSGSSSVRLGLGLIIPSTMTVGSGSSMRLGLEIVMPSTMMVGSGVIEMSACGCLVQSGSSSVRLGLGLIIPSTMMVGSGTMEVSAFGCLSVRLGLGSTKTAALGLGAGMACVVYECDL
jgi:hypothetical protein